VGYHSKGGKVQEQLEVLTMLWPEDYMVWNQSSDNGVVFDELEARFWDIHKTNSLLIQAAETNRNQTMSTNYQELVSSHEEISWIAGGAEMDHLVEGEQSSSTYIYDFLAPAMSLVALYIFVEKGLKDLCWWYEELKSLETSLPASLEIPAGAKYKVKKRRGESQIDGNLRYLVDELGINFKLRTEIAELLELSRQVRNNFAHGDWANVRRDLNKVDAPKSFELTALLFMDLSEACGKFH
jgi:hypothetical protein